MAYRPFPFDMEKYDKDILTILHKAGSRGLQLKKIVLHVCNANNTLFEATDPDEIYRYVRNFVRRNTNKPGAVLKPAAKRGCYRLNMRSKKTQQLLTEMLNDAK